MSYIPVTLNHFRSVRIWAKKHGATVSLNLESFEIEIKAQNRYFILFPRFLVNYEGRLGHAAGLTAEATGLIGWLPYRLPPQWPVAADKILFKELLVKHGHATPRWWVDEMSAEADFILKDSTGSFGYGLLGPFHSKISALELPAKIKTPAGLVSTARFAEEFVPGTNLKLWFWGNTPFFAHIHEYPTIEGDGLQTVESLIRTRFLTIGQEFKEGPDLTPIFSSLAYQGVSLQDVLPAGGKAWLDYRYGRSYAPSRITSRSDSKLADLPVAAKNSAAALGATIGTELFKIVPAPILYAVDGVIEADGNVKWLEMNMNPILPPDGYSHIFSTLFGIEVKA